MMGMMARAHRLLALALVLLTALAASAPAPDAERNAELPGLEPGMPVTDVGDGDGEWSLALARGVGESGHVYVTAIDEEEPGKIRERLEASDLSNLSVIAGKPDDTMLPDACCDAILLRPVVHHMESREAMIASLRRSLRTGGSCWSSSGTRLSATGSGSRS